MMKVIHVISSISRHLGGPSRSIQGAVAALEQAGVECWLLCLTKSEAPWFPGISHAVRLECLNGWDPSLVNRLREVLSEIHPDLLHFHGLWQWELHQAIRVAKELGISYVVAPRGMLAPWALHQKWWKKIPAWWLYQRSDLNHAHALQATSGLEARDIRKAGFTQPLLISPNGVLVPPLLPRKQVSGKMRTALFLARLHPGKGLMALVEAWGELRPRGWRMRVVGFDGYGEKARLIVRLKELDIYDFWVFEGPMDDEVKWQAFADADLFILPSVSENFGISIAEALYAGLPVITTRGTPWEELETHHCGWWTEIGSGPLTEAMREAMALPSEALAEMGRRGHGLIEEKYTWSVVARGMRDAYLEMLYP